MGGRGSYSISGRNGKVTLMGKNTGVYARNVGGATESHKDVVTLGEMAGFKEIMGLDSVGIQSMGAYISAIGALEREYGALKAVPTVLLGADGIGFYAAAGGTNNGAAMLLNRRYMSNAAKHAKVSNHESSKGFKMPTNGKLTTAATYTVKHEYGHLLQNALYKKAVENGYKGSSQKHAREIYNQIKHTAIKKYGATSKSLSSYGKSNVYEAFAESFAGLHSGNPTAFSLALRDYLNSNKL